MSSTLEDKQLQAAFQDYGGDNKAYAIVAFVLYRVMIAMCSTRSVVIVNVALLSSFAIVMACDTLLETESWSWEFMSGCGNFLQWL